MQVATPLRWLSPCPPGECTRECRRFASLVQSFDWRQQCAYCSYYVHILSDHYVCSSTFYRITQARLQAPTTHASIDAGASLCCSERRSRKSAWHGAIPRRHADDTGRIDPCTYSCPDMAQHSPNPAPAELLRTLGMNPKSPNPDTSQPALCFLIVSLGTQHIRTTAAAAYP